MQTLFIEEQIIVRFLLLVAISILFLCDRETLALQYAAWSTLWQKCDRSRSMLLFAQLLCVFAVSKPRQPFFHIRQPSHGLPLSAQQSLAVSGFALHWDSWVVESDFLRTKYSTALSCGLNLQIPRSAAQGPSSKRTDTFWVFARCFAHSLKDLLLLKVFSSSMFMFGLLRWQLAVFLLQRCREASVELDGILYSAASSACQKSLWAGFFAEALSLVNAVLLNSSRIILDCVHMVILNSFARGYCRHDVTTKGALVGSAAKTTAFTEVEKSFRSDCVPLDLCTG